PMVILPSPTGTLRRSRNTLFPYTTLFRSRADSPTARAEGPRSGDDADAPATELAHEIALVHPAHARKRGGAAIGKAKNADGLPLGAPPDPHALQVVEPRALPALLGEPVDPVLPEPETAARVADEPREHEAEPDDRQRRDEPVHFH